MNTGTTEVKLNKAGNPIIPRRKSIFEASPDGKRQAYIPKVFTEEEKKKLGRPPTYNEDQLIQLGNELIDWLNESEDNVFCEDFLHSRNIYRNFITKHCDQSDTFRDTIQKSIEIQEAKLVKKAMQNKHSTVFSIFYFKNRYPDRFSDTPSNGSANTLKTQTNIVINLPENFQQLNLPTPSGNITLDAGNITKGILPASPGNEEPPATDPDVPF